MAIRVNFTDAASICGRVGGHARCTVVSRLLYHIKAYFVACTASECPAHPTVHLGGVLHRSRAYADPRVANPTLTLTEHLTQAMAELGYRPSTSLEVGLGKFVTWYKEYYKGGTAHLDQLQYKPW